MLRHDKDAHTERDRNRHEDWSPGRIEAKTDRQNEPTPQARRQCPKHADGNQKCREVGISVELHRLVADFGVLHGFNDLPGHLLNGQDVDPCAEDRDRSASSPNVQRQRWSFRSRRSGRLYRLAISTRRGRDKVPIFGRAVQHHVGIHRGVKQHEPNVIGGGEGRNGIDGGLSGQQPRARDRACRTRLELQQIEPPTIQEILEGLLQVSAAVRKTKPRSASPAREVSIS